MPRLYHMGPAMSMSILHMFQWVIRGRSRADRGPKARGHCRRPGARGGGPSGLFGPDRTLRSRWVSSVAPGACGLVREPRPERLRYPQAVAVGPAGLPGAVGGPLTVRETPATRPRETSDNGGYVRS
jgi:hypothetical protein